MTDLQLFTKLSNLPLNLKTEVSDFVDFLINKSKKRKNEIKRVSGKAKGLIEIKESFDNPVAGFENYM